MTGLAQLSAVIASSLAEWDVPHVELAIFGVAEPAHIAEQLRRVCRFELHSSPTKALFYRSSVGAAAGLELENGERVVVKAHQPANTREHLAEVVRLQRRVESKLRLAPKVLAGPVPFGLGFATLEEFVARGAIRDGHDPVTRTGLARSLHAIVECLSTECEASTLRQGFLFDRAGEGLWPTPHSKLFDFDATTEGAGYIDELAAKARARMIPAGRNVIGHSDWRAEHLRFEGSSPTVAYDWDSLCKAREPALVGSAAHMFCSDWSRDDHVQAPTLAEARAFVNDYETARGSPFTFEERALCAAMFAYAVAYTCRCGHASGVDARDAPGNFQHLLTGEGEGLFRL
jgi:hypothetical protein